MKYIKYIVGVLVLISFFYLCGFRITYAPKLENSWAAISGVAAWVSAVATIAAVWVAVQIPKRIAEEQNKINLLNFRSEVRETIIEVSDYIWAISNFQGFNIDTLEIDKVLEIFAFAEMPQYGDNQRIIDKYKFYFRDYCDCADEFSKLYRKIAWACLRFKLGNKKCKSRDDLIKAVKQANEYVNSEKFDKLKKYMENALTMSK